MRRANQGWAEASELLFSPGYPLRRFALCILEGAEACSTLGLRQRKSPRTVEDFRSWAEQAHGVVPSLRDW